MKITERQIRDDLHRGYVDARRYKRTTLAQIEFEECQEPDLEELANSLVTRTYRPKPAFCFITFDPVQREVFASQFEDRIVQHMLYSYLYPLFDRLFIYDTYSCRIGKGTHFGVERFCHHLRSVTNNFHEEAYVLMIDLSGYFMSIDKKLLIDETMRQIDHHLYRRSPDGRLWVERIDPDFCEYLLHCFLDRNPSEECYKLGDPSNWDGLPANKMLANSPEGVGIVIGDIISQVFSNVILNITDQWAKREKHLKHWGHYVDDHFTMHRDLAFLTALVPELQEVFLERAHVNLHPKKWHITPANGGNQFLGAYVHPKYQLPRQRTVDTFVRTTQEMEYQMIFSDLTYNDLDGIRSRINSYCGLFKHQKSYGLRKEYLDRPAFHEYFYFDDWYTKAVLKAQYEQPISYFWGKQGFSL